MATRRRFIQIGAAIGAGLTVHCPQLLTRP
jgi:hypothetical protein